MFYSNKKGVSALIATILLIVVAVALIAIILTWGKGFTTKQIAEVDTFKDASDTYFIKPVTYRNGSLIIENLSTVNSDINIIGYKIISDNPDFNTDIVYLTTPVILSKNSTKKIFLTSSPSTRFDIQLYTADGKYIDVKNITGTSATASLSITCPTGYIPVPGNTTYGTLSFCVAKYDMKVDQDDDNIGDTNTDCQAYTYGTWDNSATGCEYNTGSRHIVSTKEGYPLATISQTDAITACSSLGDNYHLITNNEWMTIARNIEQVTSNWSGGAVGNGYIYSGHNDDNPNSALEASTDQDGYYGEGDPANNQRRTLTLTNGEVIWDLAGNIYQWTSDTISSDNVPQADTEGSYYGEYSDLYTAGDFGTLGYDGLFLSSSHDYNSDNGIGTFYSCGTACSGEEYTIAFLRGDSWGNETDAGLLHLDLGYGPGDTDASIGFRCVVVP